MLINCYKWAQRGYAMFDPLHGPLWVQQGIAALEYIDAVEAEDRARRAAVRGRGGVHYG